MQEMWLVQKVKNNGWTIVIKNKLNFDNGRTEI
jgi:hypothetical protein